LILAGAIIASQWKDLHRRPGGGKSYSRMGGVRGGGDTFRREGRIPSVMVMSLPERVRQNLEESGEGGKKREVVRPQTKASDAS